MNPFTTLALRSDQDITPLSRSGSDITGYVFRDADDAIEYGNTHLSQNADEWVTESHDFDSLVEWVNAIKETNGVTHLAFDPDSAHPKLIPIDSFPDIARRSE